MEMQYIKDIMSRRLITLAPDDRVLDHLKIFEENGINHVPVTENRAVVGIVSRKDFENYVNITRVLQAVGDDPVLVRDIMTAPVFTYHENIHIEAAAQAMIDNVIHAIVITNEKQELEGIVTITDILKYVANRDRYSGL